jgi:hypothetical protein
MGDASFAPPVDSRCLFVGGSEAGDAGAEPRCINFIVASLDDITFACLPAIAIVRYEGDACGIDYYVL